MYTMGLVLIVVIAVASVSYHTVQGYDMFKCEQSADLGDCNTPTTKWAYCCERNVCDSFEYLGCGGNSNRFDSKEECESACKKDYTGCFAGKALQKGRSLGGKGSDSSSSSSSSEEKKDKDNQDDDFFS